MVAWSGEENRPWQMKRGRKSSTVPRIIWSHYTGRTASAGAARCVSCQPAGGVSVSTCVENGLEASLAKELLGFHVPFGSGCDWGGWWTATGAKVHGCLCDLLVNWVSNTPGVICPTSGLKSQESERCVVKMAYGMLSSYAAELTDINISYEWIVNMIFLFVQQSCSQ